MGALQGQGGLGELAYWGLRFREKFGDYEDGWKGAGYDQLAAVRHAFLSGDETWFKSLLRVLSRDPISLKGGLGTVVHWSVRARLKDWNAQHPAQMWAAFETAWKPDADLPAALDGILAGLRPLNPGVGNRLALAAVVAGAVDPHRFPPFAQQAFRRAYRSVSYPQPPKGRSDLDEYLHALGFLDALRAAAVRVEPSIDSRLKAHSLLWYAMKYKLPSEWPAADVDALMAFRGEGGTSSDLADRSAALLKELGRELQHEGAFDAEDEPDARARVLRSVLLRYGQPAFRAGLLEAYRGRCAVTGCDAEEALEAAHILAVAEDGNDDITNGILLRSDLHTLFDRGLLTFDTVTWTVVLHPTLRHGHYAELHGAQLALPDEQRWRPNPSALDEHRHECRL